MPALKVLYAKNKSGRSFIFLTYILFKDGMEYHLSAVFPESAFKAKGEFVEQVCEGLTFE